MKSLAFASIAVFSLAVHVSHAAEFKLTSPDVGPNKPLAKEFVYSGSGCTGDNLSPELSWTNAPPDTRSFAIALFDPDAMNGRGFWHWLMVNIPAGTNSLSRDAGKNDGTKAPSGAVQLRNGFRAAGYSGSCPPAGDKPHSYTYTVYALKVDTLDVAGATNLNDVLAQIEAQSLGNAALTYQFARPAP